MSEKVISYENLAEFKRKADEKYQDKLTPGANILIDENNVISATGGGATYQGGDGIWIDSDNRINVDTGFVATQSDLSSKQDRVIAGYGISMADDVTISVDSSMIPTHDDVNAVEQHVQELANDVDYRLNDKQDTIDDLDAIRAGAEAGAAYADSPASSIRDEDINSWNSKQDAIEFETGFDINADYTVRVSVASTIIDGAALGATALQEETDPVFTMSPAGTIESQDIDSWNNKQDKLTFTYVEL